MNITENVADSRTIKMHYTARAGFIQAEIKTLSLKQGKHVMEPRIAIGEFDRCTDRHYEDVRVEGLVFLNKTGRRVRGRCPPRCAGARNKPDHKLRKEVSLVTFFCTNEDNMTSDGIFLCGCDTKDRRQKCKSEENPHTAPANP